MVGSVQPGQVDGLCFDGSISFCSKMIFSTGMLSRFDFSFKYFLIGFWIEQKGESKLPRLPIFGSNYENKIRLDSVLFSMG